MIDPSDVRRRVERSLETAIQLKIQENPKEDPNKIMESSLVEFNKHFEGVYKIDSVKLTKDTLDINVVKANSDKDNGQGELVYG